MNNFVITCITEHFNDLIATLPLEPFDLSGAIIAQAACHFFTADISADHNVTAVKGARDANNPHSEKTLTRLSQNPHCTGVENHLSLRSELTCQPLLSRAYRLTVSLKQSPNLFATT